MAGSNGEGGVSGSRPSGIDPGDAIGVSRRQLIGAGGTALAVGLAGCGGGVDETHEFEAEPVSVPKASRQDLVVSETFRDTLVHEDVQDLEGNRARIRLLNQGAAYTRTRSEPTLLEAYVDNATDRGAGGAVVVPASELGLAADELTGGLWDGWGVPIERIGLLVPEGARADDRVELGETMVVADGGAASQAEVEVSTNALTGLLMPPPEFLPRAFYVPGEFYVPGSFYVPDDFTSPGGFASGGILYVDIEQRVSRLFDRVELPGESVTGDTVDVTNVMLAAPGDAVFEHPGGFDPEAVFDLGEPAPLAGREFGVTGLSTPKATVDGQSVTPLLEMPMTEFLAHDHPRRLLRAAGVTEADDVEWLRGPNSIVPEWYTPPSSTLAGTSVDVTAYGGVVTGVNGPQAVVMFAAEVMDSDRVLGGGIAARPVGSPDGRSELVGETGFISRERFTRAAGMAATALSEIVHGEE